MRVNSIWWQQKSRGTISVYDTIHLEFLQKSREKVFFRCFLFLRVEWMIIVAQRGGTKQKWRNAETEILFEHCDSVRTIFKWLMELNADNLQAVANRMFSLAFYIIAGEKKWKLFYVKEKIFYEVCAKTNKFFHR